MSNSLMWRAVGYGLAFPFLLVGGWVGLSLLWPVELWQAMRASLRDEAVRDLLPNRRKGALFMLVQPPEKPRELRN